MNDEWRAVGAKRFFIRHSTFSVFLAALILYALTAVLGGNFHHQKLAHFNLLADALLRGDLYLANPIYTHDLIRFQGRWFVPFPPGAALLLVPFVALFGVNFNEVALSVVVGAGNVALIYGLLRALTRQGFSRLDGQGVLWLMGLFAAGTAHWYAAASGGVSFLAHICAVTGLTAALLLAATGRSPWLIGLAMAWALLSRPTLVLATPAVAVLWLEARRRLEPTGATQDVGSLLRAAALLAPQAAALALLLAYNRLRFGNWLEFGYQWAQTTFELGTRLVTWGQFNWHYLPENLRVALAGLPLLRNKVPFIWPDPNGLSLFLATPTFLWLYTALRRDRVAIAAWLSLGLVCVPLLLYFNTGWVQFGYRFSLDFLPLAFMLLAMGLQRISPLVKASIGLAWCVHLWGVVWWFARVY